MGRKLLFGILCLSLLSRPVCADVFERDLVPGSGDGLLTFDDVNQREWLDLTESILVNFPDGAVNELEPGGVFEDFTWATAEDVRSLAESGGIDTTTLDFSTNQSNGLLLLHMLGVTRDFLGIPDGAGGSSRGLVNTKNEPTFDSIAAVFVSPTVESAGFATSSSFGSSDRPGVSTGLFLYREIPEPNAIVLICTGVLALSCQRVPRMRARKSCD